MQKRLRIVPILRLWKSMTNSNIDNPDSVVLEPLGVGVGEEGVKGRLYNYNTKPTA